jgi:hypothetical protein
MGCLQREHFGLALVVPAWVGGISGPGTGTKNCKTCFNQLLLGGFSIMSKMSVIRKTERVKSGCGGPQASIGN